MVGGRIIKIVMNKQNITRMLGLVCFTVGLVLGLVLITASVWADLEAQFYGFQRFYAEGLEGLSCPILMERSETGNIIVSMANDTDLKIDRAVIARLSSRIMISEERQRVVLEPGETKQVAFPISASNLELGRFIFAHIMTPPAYQTPMQEAMCGVFVVGAPGLTGQQLYYGLMAVTVVGLGLGLWLWNKSRPPDISRLKQVRLAMNFLVVMILLGLVMTALGNWMVGVVLLVVVALTMGSVMFLATSS